MLATRPPTPALRTEDYGLTRLILPYPDAARVADELLTRDRPEIEGVCVRDVEPGVWAWCECAGALFAVVYDDEGPRLEVLIDWPGAAYEGDYTREPELGRHWPELLGPVREVLRVLAGMGAPVPSPL